MEEISKKVNDLCYSCLQWIDDDTDLSGHGTLRNMFHQRVTTIAT